MSTETAPPAGPCVPPGEAAGNPTVAPFFAVDRTPASGGRSRASPRRRTGRRAGAVRVRGRQAAANPLHDEDLAGARDRRAGACRRARRGAYIVWHLRNAAPPTTGTLRIASRPDGAEVYIDGQRQGTSPIDLNLQAGRHDLELRHGTMSRRESVDISAGQSAVHSFDLGPAPAGTGGEATATLELITEPSGARVSVDGRARGRRRWSSPISHQACTTLSSRPARPASVVRSGWAPVRRRL